MTKNKGEKAAVKSYKEFNIIVICLAAAMIFLPLIVDLIRKINPKMIRCIYYEVTSKPCPFCGFTTDIRNILKGNILAYKYNILSVPCLIGAVIEISVRFKLLKSGKWSSESKIKTIMKNDLILHIVLFSLIIIYIICYFIFDLRRF